MSICKSVVLGCGVADAFALFTEHAGAWWPEDRRHTRDPGSEIRILPGGRFYERSGDGHEVELGRVREFEPPERLVLDFYVGTSAAEPTEVIVTFRAEGAGTRVTVDHRALPASEAAWRQRAPVFERSWDAVLAAMALHAGRS